MKKLVLFVALSIGSIAVAQVNAPAASPLSKVEQQVGLTDVVIEYSRPSMKGRTIFGDLVPYDKLWRTGANARTTISFDNTVAFSGEKLEAGTYALFTIPGKDQWRVIFYTEHQGSGAPKELDDSKVAASFTVKPITTTMHTETFTMQIGDLSHTGGTLFMMWEKTMVPITMEVDTDKEVMASIEKELSGPSAMDYYTAASYYYDTGKDPKQAKEYIDKALADNANPPFWQLRLQSLIYAKAGDKKGAIKAAEKSLAAAKKAGNDDYVKMNETSLKEWGAK